MQPPNSSFRYRFGGFTLLELIVAIGIVAILAALAVPNFTKWIQSTKVRSVAEALQNDLRMAQGEAIRQNHPVVFSLISAPTATAPVIFTSASAGTTSNPSSTFTAVTPGTNWMGYTTPVITGESYQYVVGGDNGNLESPVQIAGANSSGANATITFTPFGRISNGLDQTYDITNAPGRALRVTITASGSVRMCDPSRSITVAPDGC